MRANPELLNPRDPFTIGYLHARAMWLGIGEITACVHHHGRVDSLVQSVKSNQNLWYPQLCLDAIRIVAARCGWDWDAYVREVEGLVGVSGIIDNLGPIVGQDVTEGPAHNDIRGLIARISEHASEILRQSKRSRASNAEIKMLFVGQQIGKIDQLVVEGEKYNSLESILPACREALATLFVEITEQDIADVLNEFRVVKNMVAKVDQRALKHFVAQLKQAFLSEM